MLTLFACILALTGLVWEMIIAQSKRASHHRFLSIPFSYILSVFATLLTICTATVSYQLQTPEKQGSYLYAALLISASIAIVWGSYMATELVVVWRKRNLPEIAPPLLITLSGLLAWSTIPYAFIASFLASHTIAFVLIHNIGAVLGVGGTTYLDIFIHQKLKRAHVGTWHHAAGSARLFAQMIFLGLALLTLSGVALLIPHAHILFSSTKFLTKLILLAVVTVNGGLMHFLILPQLLEHQSKRSVRLFYASSGVSLTSWYSIFILGSVGRIVTPPLPFMLAGAILIFAIMITISQLIARKNGW